MPTAAAHATHAHVAPSTTTAPPQQAQQAPAQPHPHSHHQPTLATATAQVAGPYQAYGLPNLDMSTFQGVDWSSMYGIGYV